ncbi:MAG: Gfo/Idh/MocA family oxidoreductase [Verrucomicrobia bacterium]|nr:Gfo/Idh/MocA family oxidoreductase [Verrucomicrobiota bacterium]
MKLRIGFLGVGGMGFSHLKAIQEHHADVAEAAAICPASEANLQRALAAAPGAKAFREERRLIESGLDAIFVSTPNFTHVPLGLEILRAGKHLFLEKPVGITPEECRQMVQAAGATDRTVLIGHELRYSPYFQKIKALVEEGEIGQPRLVWCREFRGPFQKKSRDWIQDDRQSGGALVDKNCHHFDLMNWWAQSRPKRVCAFGGNAVERVLEGEHQVLDHATVSFEHENGVRGTLQLCMFAPDQQGEELEMGVAGDAGLLRTRLSRLEILVWKRKALNKEPVIHSVEAKRGEGWGGHLGFAEIHEAFLKAILEKKPHLTSVRDCVDGTLLAIAAEESIKKRRVIEIQ